MGSELSKKRNWQQKKEEEERLRKEEEMRRSRKEKTSHDASTKGKATGCWTRCQGTKENRQRNGQCPRRSPRNDQNQRTIGRGKENFLVHPYQAFGLGRNGWRPTHQQSH